MPTISSLVEHAISTATRLHWDQTRKGTGNPYIIHPYMVGLMVAKHTSEEATLCAAFLHDVLEDVDESIYSAADLKDEFGTETLEMVKELTEPDRTHPWRERKERYLRQIGRTQREGVMIICAADKIHNLQSMIDSFRREGESFWHSFHGSPLEELWFYGEALRILKSKSDHPLIRELEKTYLDASHHFKLDIA